MQSFGILQVELRAVERDRPVVTLLVEQVAGSSISGTFRLCSLWCSGTPFAISHHAIDPCLAGFDSLVDFNRCVKLLRGTRSVRALKQSVAPTVLCLCFDKRKTIAPRYLNGRTKVTAGFNHLPFRGRQPALGSRDRSSKSSPVFSGGHDLPTPRKLERRVSEISHRSLKKCQVGTVHHFHDLVADFILGRQCIGQKLDGRSALAKQPTVLREEVKMHGGESP